MTKGFLVTEEAPDRDYFTIVPNYIVNHSTIYEQGIYLVMKRIAGEGGNCYTSHQSIAKRAGISRQTVSRIVQKLIKRGWIKETGKVAAKTHPVRNYQIVDLWKVNSDYYRTQKICTPQSQSFKNKKDMLTTERKICTPQSISFGINTTKNEAKNTSISTKEEEPMEEDNTDINTNVLISGNGLPETINDLIKLFEPVNPSYKQLFKNKTERESLRRLVEQYGLEDLKRKIGALPRIISMPYAPKIIRPSLLESKMGELNAFVEQERNKAKGKPRAVNVEEGIAFLEREKTSVNVD